MGGIACGTKPIPTPALPLKEREFFSRSVPLIAKHYTSPDDDESMNYRTHYAGAVVTIHLVRRV